MATGVVWHFPPIRMLQNLHHWVALIAILWVQKLQKYQLTWHFQLGRWRHHSIHQSKFLILMKSPMTHPGYPSSERFHVQKNNFLSAYWSKEIWDDYWSVTTGQKQTYLFSHLLPIYVFFIIVSTDDVMMSHKNDSNLWRHFHSKFYSIYFERETFDKTIL